MELFINIILLIVGLALLIKGADFFVDGASKIAKLLKVPTLIVGLTIVALGTSLPELSVSVVAAINTTLGNNSVDLSVGNVVGSNICNTLLVLGCTAVLTPVAIETKTLKFEIPFLLFVSVLLMVAGMTGEKAITWYYGVIFLLLLVFYIAFLIIRTKKETKGQEEKEEPDQKNETVFKKIILPIIYLIGGGCAIAGGGELVNSSAQIIASWCGMEQKLIALTIVAIGTSLPELVTSIVAIKKGENDIALGNVLGSNILNILFILGIAAVITPLPISTDLNFDLIFLVFITVVLVIFAIFSMKKQGLYRITGITLLVLYAFYMFYIIGRNYGFLPSWMVI